MMSCTCAALALVLLVAFEQFAVAGTIGPKKPSSLRTVKLSAPCTAVEQKSDGTTAPFSIPTGMVFIVTSWEWVTGPHIDPTAPAGVLLQHGDQVVSMGATGVTTNFSVVLDGSGAGIPSAAGGHTVIPSGVAVTGSVPLCIFPMNASTASAVVHGFLSKDK